MWVSVFQTPNLIATTTQTVENLKQMWLPFRPAYRAAGFNVKITTFFFLS